MANAYADPVYGISKVIKKLTKIFESLFNEYAQ